MSASIFENPIFAGLYSDPQVAAHLSPDAEIAAMIRFEAALATVEARLGVIPEAAGPAIASALPAVALTPESLRAGTRSAGVPVPALVKALRDAVPAPNGQYVHWGATSQDVVDTGLVLRLRDVLRVLEERLRRLIALLADEAERHAGLAMAGRTRSQIATPTTLGLRIAGWAAPLGRCLDRLAELRPRLLVVQFGGASGNLSVLGEKAPEALEALARELALGAPEKPWGMERDGLVELANWLAMVSGLLARMASDLILMGRSEIAELAAGTGGGSSTMPQKQNPVLAETLVALGRFNAGQIGVMQTALLHLEERDGTAWATEWTALPQMLLATGAGLLHGLELAASLRPDTARIRETMTIDGGAIHAEALAFALARQVPLQEAQAMLKDAAKASAEAGGALADHLARLCAEKSLTMPEVDEGPAVVNGRAFVERTVAALRKRL